MRLTDLDPRWVTPDMFIFKNPTGGRFWLSCKRVSMHPCNQIDLAKARYPDLDDLHIVSGREGHSWAFEGDDFGTLTVTPSIDASASGNWHGHITGGQIV